MADKQGVPFRARHGAKFFWVLLVLGVSAWIASWTGAAELNINFGSMIIWIGLAFGWAQEMYERGRTDGALSAWSRFNKMIDESENNDRS